MIKRCPLCTRKCVLGDVPLIVIVGHLFSRSTSPQVDDFVFEDFARLGLTGIKDEGDPFC